MAADALLLLVVDRLRVHVLVRVREHGDEEVGDAPHPRRHEEREVDGDGPAAHVDQLVHDVGPPDARHAQEEREHRPADRVELEQVVGLEELLDRRHAPRRHAAHVGDEGGDQLARRVRRQDRRRRVRRVLAGRPQLGRDLVQNGTG